jgi:hypothetical protein
MKKTRLCISLLLIVSGKITTSERLDQGSPQDSTSTLTSSTARVDIQEILTDSAAFDCESLTMNIHAPAAIGRHFHRHEPEKKTLSVVHQDDRGSLGNQFKQHAIAALANVVIQQVFLLSLNVTLEYLRDYLSPQNKALKEQEERLIQQHTLSQLKTGRHSEASLLMTRILQLQELINSETDEASRILLTAQLRSLKNQLNPLAGPVELTQEEFSKLETLQAN